MDNPDDFVRDSGYADSPVRQCSDFGEDICSVCTGVPLYSGTFCPLKRGLLVADHCFQKCQRGIGTTCDCFSGREHCSRFCYGSIGLLCQNICVEMDCGASGRNSALFLAVAPGIQ